MHVHLIVLSDLIAIVLRVVCDAPPRLISTCDDLLLNPKRQPTFLRIVKFDSSVDGPEASQTTTVSFNSLYLVVVAFVMCKFLRVSGVSDGSYALLHSCAHEARSSKPVECAAQGCIHRDVHHLLINQSTTCSSISRVGSTTADPLSWQSLMSAISYLVGRLRLCATVASVLYAIGCIRDCRSASWHSWQQFVGLETRQTEQLGCIRQCFGGRICWLWCDHRFYPFVFGCIPFVSGLSSFRLCC